MRLANRHKPLFNVTISNVPGPAFPLYSAGVRLTAWYPMGPIFDGTGLNLTVMSYMGVMHFGVVGCRETVRSVHEIATALEEAMEELLTAARATSGAAAAPVKAVRPASKRRPKAKVTTG